RVAERVVVALREERQRGAHALRVLRREELLHCSLRGAPLAVVLHAARLVVGEHEEDGLRVGAGRRGRARGEVAGGLGAVAGPVASWRENSAGDGDRRVPDPGAGWT